MKKSNTIILLLGSNIEPDINIKKALDTLNQVVKIRNQSNIWITEAVGSQGPNFFNMAVEIETPLNHSQVKNKIINPIETELKRVRTSDKYAPRTIDIDMIFFHQELIDPNLWDKLFIALPVSEIDPNIKNEKSGETIRTIVKRLKRSAYAERFN